MTKYHERISYRINEFLLTPKSVKSKRNYGMSDIYRDIDNIVDDIPLKESSKYPDASERIMAIFTYMMNKRIVEENGELFILADYAPTGKVYKKTGDPIFAWQNKMSLKEYRNGSLEFPITPKILKKLNKAVEKARIIADEMHVYMNKHHNQSVEAIMEKLKIAFGLNEKELRLIFWNPNTKQASDMVKTLSDKKQELYYKMLNSFQNYALLEPMDMHGVNLSDNPNYKQDHYPVIFQRETFPYMWDAAISRLESDRESLRDELDTVEGTERMAVKAEIKRLDSVISRMKFIRDRMDGYHIDTALDIILPLGTDNKFIKRISNMLPLTAMRTDAGVYYTYAKTVMAGIQRNLLTAQLIDSLTTASSEKMQDALINYYKVPFNRPDVQTNFLGTYVSLEDVSRRLGSVNINISPENLNRHVRTFNSFLSANYLSGIGTVTQNFMAINQNIIDHGYRSFSDALKSWGNYREEWSSLINRSGIVEFRDFFSKAMVNDLANAELEDSVSETILGSMIQFHKEKNQIGEEKAMENFKNNIQKALDSSAIYGTVINPLRDVERINKRSKERRRNKNLRVMNKYVNWAINKEFEINKHIKGWKTVPYKLIGKGYLEFVANASRGFGMFDAPVSMGSTESFIRTISFIIGVQQARKNGYIQSTDKNGNNLHPWELTDANEIGKVIEIGRTFSRFTNFGLSTTDVGEGSHGGIGQLNMKFKYWSQQKFGRDVRIIKNALITMQDINKLGGRNPFFDIKAVMKTFALMMNPKYMVDAKKLRTINPEVAALRNFLLIQGTLTVLFDFFIFGPIGVGWMPGPVGRYLFGRGPLKSLRGVSSDLISMSLAIPMLAVYMTMGEDDPEDMERYLNNYMRRTYIGFAPTFLWDNITFLFWLALGEAEAASNKAQRISGIVPLLPKSGEAIVGETVEEILD